MTIVNNSMLVVFLQACCSKLCGGVEIDENLQCCNNSFACNGICHVNGSNNYSVYKCITPFDNMFCVQGVGFPISFAVLAAPVLIFSIVNLIRPRTPIMSFLYGLTMNFLYAITIVSFYCYELTGETFILLGCISIFLLITEYAVCRVGVCSESYTCRCNEPGTRVRSRKTALAIKKATAKAYGLDESAEPDFTCRCSKCCLSPNDFLAVQRELQMQRIDKESMHIGIERNYFANPTPRVVGEAFHLEGSTPIVDKTIVKSIKYGDFEERGKKVEYNEKPLTIYYCTTDYIYDLSISQKIDAEKEAVIRELTGTGEFRRSYDDVDTVGKMTEVINSDSCIGTCCNNSFCNCILYNFLMIIGYNYLFDTIWRQCADIVVFDSIKYVASENVTGPHPHYENENAEAEAQNHGDDVEVALL